MHRLLEEAMRENGTFKDEVRALSLRAGVSAQQFDKMVRELEALRSSHAEATAENQRLLSRVSLLEGNVSSLQVQLLTNDIHESCRLSFFPSGATSRISHVSTFLPSRLHFSQISSLVICDTNHVTINL